jgi:hypothetical protein
MLSVLRLSKFVCKRYKISTGNPMETPNTAKANIELKISNEESQ